MKKLLGIVFCFSFLLFAGSITIHAQKTNRFTESFANADVAFVEKATISFETTKHQETFVCVLKTVAFDASKLRQPYIQIVKLGLFSNYRLIPDCHVYVINKRARKYYYNYLPAVSSNYNQPQIYRYSCQRSYNI